MIKYEWRREDFARETDLQSVHVPPRAQPGAAKPTGRNACWLRSSGPSRVLGPIGAQAEPSRPAGVLAKLRSCPGKPYILSLIEQCRLCRRCYIAQSTLVEKRSARSAHSTPLKMVRGSGVLGETLLLPTSSRFKSAPHVTYAQLSRTCAGRRRAVVPRSAVQKERPTLAYSS